MLVTLRGQRGKASIAQEERSVEIIVGKKKNVVSPHRRHNSPVVGGYF